MNNPAYINEENKSLPEYFSFGFFRIDNESKLIYTNDMFLNILGYDSIEKLQVKIYTDSNLNRLFNSERLFQLQDSTNQKNKTCWIKSSRELLFLREHVKKYIDNNEKIFIDCFVEDLTENSLLEKMFRDIHSSDYSVLKAIPDPIFVLSADGIISDIKNNYRILFPDLVHFHGISIFDLFEKEIADKILKLIGETLQNGESESFEFECRNLKEKQYFEIHLAIRSNAEVIMILRDITLQKTAEKKIIKISDELCESNATKDKFLSIIGHDLKSPLNGLLGYAEILSTEYDNLDKAEIKEFADYILEIVRNTQNLLSNLLEWSKIQSYKLTFNPEQVMISKVIQKIKNLLGAGAYNKNVNLIIDVDPNLIVYADENMLHSIFLNLVGNAIKFTHEGGFVKIKANEQNDHIKFSIMDNGIGISDDNIRKLMDTNCNGFTTLGTAKEKGTGLGIMLCREFIKLHNGYFKVESKIASGTTISFSVFKNLLNYSYNEIKDGFSCQEKY